MVLARYSYVFLCLVCCVSADEWSDLENDLVTDLAPLISLFGEQVTTQCMSELITALDDYIFALAPIGILTALVSLIRICGNSTLRAFIGRASEDPGDSELELLSCVSDTTAEVFTESGVARITGNPKILEVVANESGTVTVQKVSELEGKRWTDLEKDATLPNLSLNKGIKRRAPFWFHLAALFGTILQLGVIIYAALTVFKWPESFLKDGARANSYAFPMFAIGTAILTLGMFFCALLLERFSKKRFLTLPKESRVYWIQPGNQGVGDQKLPSFVGQTDKGAHFTRSVRHHSPDEVLNISKGLSLMTALSLTIVGFLIQFVGLRGLHPSVILAQLGLTIVMTVVRTSLRAQRMHEGDNLLKDDQDLVCNGEHELDWLVFHLFTIRSFRIRSVSSLPMQEPQPQSDSIVRESLIVREKLTKLAGSHWNKTPARKLAQDLGQATQELMKLIRSWSDKDVTYFDIVIPLELEKDGSQETIQYDYKMRLSSGAKVDVDLWEAILGLYVWSLRQANREMGDEHGNHFFRALESRNKNAHQARLLYQKWTNDESASRQNQASTTFLNGSNKFGNFNFRTGNPADSAALVGVSCDLYTLAAQDIYMHVLNSMLEWLPEIGGTTQITGKEKKNYKLSNDRIEVLTEGFVKSGLGDQRGSAVCILSVLSDRGLLPEITYKSVEVRQHLDELATSNDLRIYDMTEWLCSVADYEEVEHVLVEYGYLCLSNIMNQEGTEEPPALKRIMAILNTNDCSHSLNSISRNLVNISSIPGAEWQERYRNEMYWIASRMLHFKAERSHSEQAILYSRELEKLYAAQCSMEETYTDQEAAVLSQSALFDLWIGLDFASQLSKDHAQIILDWLVSNKRDNILEWLIMRLILETSPGYIEGNLQTVITYAAVKGYRKAVEISMRHIDTYDLRGFMITFLASEGDVRTLEFLLGRNLSVGSSREHESALSVATERKQYSVIKFLLEGGVNVDAVNINNATALEIAARNGDIDIVSLLLTHNASLEKKDSGGDTALIVAAASGNLNVVELLINKGANVNTLGFKGRTALMAATLCRNLPLVKYLCDKKADIHVVNDDQMSALDIAERGDFLNGLWMEGFTYLESLGTRRHHG